MKKNTFDSYLAGIKTKYEIEKTKEYSIYLSKPTPASLKNLCSILNDNDLSATDKEILNKFIGSGNFDIDKFRPICNFLIGKTKNPAQSIVDVMALLVDFKPRPLGKYLKNVVIEDNLETTENEAREDFLEKTSENLVIQPESKKVVEINDIKVRDGFVKRNKTKIVGIVSLVALSTFLIIKAGNNDKQCMQWQNDHYEVVDCKTESVGFANINSKIPLEKNLLLLTKIKVCDTTTFFRHNKAIVWYYKKGDQLEFFNAPGFHPENDKPLKPITQYMVDKYVKN